MAGVLANGVWETTSTTGTGDITLGGARPGYRTVSSALSNGDTAVYAIHDSGNNVVEWGVGTYSSGSNTFARSKVLGGSNGTNAVNLSTGTKDFIITVLAEQLYSPFHMCEGRLTLTTATPVTTSDVTGATNIYWTPYKGNRLALWNDYCWVVDTFTELTLAIGTLTSGLLYDVFAYDNNGAVNLDPPVAWASTSARSVALATKDGIYVKSTDNKRRYLGTFATTSTTTTEDSSSKRYLVNAYNRVDRLISKSDATTHTYASATIREWNGTSSVNRVSFLAIDNTIGTVNRFSVNTSFTGSGADKRIKVGIGVNSTTSFTAAIVYSGGNQNDAGVSWVDSYSLGLHFISVNEQALDNTTCNLYYYNLIGSVLA